MSQNLSSHHAALDTIVKLFSAHEHEAVITHAQQLLGNLAVEKISTPAGLQGMYGISLLSRGQLQAAVKALENELTISPNAEFIRRIYPVACQAYASVLGGRAQGILSYSNSPEGKALAQKILALPRSVQYKKNLIAYLHEKKLSAEPYVSALERQQDYVDVLLLNEWAIECASPHQMLVVGASDEVLIGRTKSVSPHTQLVVVSARDDVTKLSETLVQRSGVNRNFDLIAFDQGASLLDIMECVRRVMPYLAPSGLIIGRDVVRDTDNAAAWDRIKQRYFDSLFCFAEDGLFVITKCPMTMLLARAGA